MRDVRWCVTDDYQQIVISNLANQIYGFTIDYGKFILNIHNGWWWCLEHRNMFRKLKSVVVSFVLTRPFGNQKRFNLCSLLIPNYYIHRSLTSFPCIIATARPSSINTDWHANMFRIQKKVLNNQSWVTQTQLKERLVDPPCINFWTSSSVQPSANPPLTKVEKRTFMISSMLPLSSGAAIC